MRISKKQSEDFTKAFLKVRQASHEIPYSDGYKVYQSLISDDGDILCNHSIEELALGILVWSTLVTTYFVAAVDQGLIKIGKTQTMGERFNSLQSMSPAPLKLAYTFDYDDGLEKRIHEKLKDHRAHGEWFYANEEVLDFIRGIKEGGSEWVVEQLGEGARNWAFATEMRGQASRLLFGRLLHSKERPFLGVA